MLKDDDSSTVATPYTAAVLEYRVVYHDSTDASILDKSMSMSNGHAVHDAQHPCRYQKNVLNPKYFSCQLIICFCFSNLTNILSWN